MFWQNAISQLEGLWGRCQTTVISSRFCPFAKLCLGSQPGSCRTSLSSNTPSLCLSLSLCFPSSPPLSLRLYTCLSTYRRLLALNLPASGLPCAFPSPCPVSWGCPTSGSISRVLVQLFEPTRGAHKGWEGEKQDKARMSFSFCLSASESVPSSGSLRPFRVSSSPREPHGGCSLCQRPQPLASGHTTSSRVLPAEGRERLTAVPTSCITTLVSG